jgi:histidine triad (HIT) family protein
MQGEDKQNAVQRGGFDPHTVFSKILNGELPATFVYRNEQVSAFMDIQPINPGHVLVVPNKPATTLATLPAETGAEMFRVGQRIAAAIRASGIECEGINLVLSDGVAAGQTVFHLHLHVFPRFAGDGFRWKLPDRYYTPPVQTQLESLCERIKASLTD